MAAIRLRIASLFWLLLVVFLSLATASPTHTLLPRSSFTVNNDTGTVQVFDGSGNLVTQGAATDGSGSNFDFPALIWIGFSLIIGLPMSFAGIRGWRLTTGVGIGVASAVCIWSGIVNTVNGSGVADLFLTAIIIVIFFCGFALGVFEIGRLGGITMIGIAGGIAFGVRIVLLRAGLLVSSTELYALNWVIVAICGGAGGLGLIWFQRYALLFGCASIGTFFTALGVDLVLSKQSGMSAGLRLLFDRNDSHVAFLLAQGYTPLMKTRVILIASLVLVPALAVAQHRFFPQPFTRRPEESDAELAINYPTAPVVETKRTTFLMDLWDGVRNKPDSINRFSIV
ncbi:SET domain-containing protein [Mycena sanguinolenta]|uniref:SET domain-containing protein n=1 Tax=Mycena sanguinolenta TaxID=230812 RepID=A0A8H7CUI6_9AGAR|nr:SET domain-containing protein [Mycena sanguinolenta]